MNGANGAVLHIYKKRQENVLPLLKYHLKLLFFLCQVAVG